MPLPASAVGQVDMRSGAPVRFGAYRHDAENLVTPWHSHDLHQLIYAFEGSVRVRTASSEHLLPPQQAAWIPAGLEHRTTLRRVRSGSIFFSPDLVPGAGGRVRVLPATPVIREMIRFSMRWPIDRPTSDRTADSCFEALGLLCAEWIEHDAPLSLPISPDPAIARAMAYTQDHLRDVQVVDVCAAAGMSERSLRRHFAARAGMTWQRYRLHSRLLHAMSLLAEGDLSVLQTADRVGFDSVSAFTRAFTRLVGETPSAYRRRVTAAPAD